MLETDKQSAWSFGVVLSVSTDLVQDLTVAGQELGQVLDELFDALQTPLLHDGPCLLSDGLRDGVS